jgi:hypothetical protein
LELSVKSIRAGEGLRLTPAKVSAVSKTSLFDLSSVIRDRAAQRREAGAEPSLANANNTYKRAVISEVRHKHNK